MYDQPSPSVGLIEAAKRYCNNATNFKGRARRSEYWMAYLFLILVNLAASFVVGLLGGLLGELGAAIGGLAFGLWGLYCLIASLALCARRLHDTGKSGWWILLCLTGIGSIVLLVFFCLDSTEDNRWGPNPKFVRPAASAPVRPASIPVQREFENDIPVGGPASRPSYAPYQDQTQTQTAYTAAVPATAQVPVMQATPAVYGTLQLYSGPMAGKSYRLPEGRTVTIGRSKSRCQIALPEYNVVSGEHCRITICNNYINITDLGSTNGTFVNGIRLTPHKTVSARPSATIYLANNTCAFRVQFD